MKKYFVHSSLLMVYGLFIGGYVFAENIQTGNASAQSSVTTTTSGSDCSTHITVTVNGQTKTLDSSDCGTQSLNLESNSSSQSSSPVPKLSVFNPKPTVSITPASSASQASVIVPASKQEAPKANFFQTIIKRLQDFFSGVFNSF